MNDEAFRLELRAELDRALAGTDNLEDYLRVVLTHTSELVGVPGSYSISTTLYGRPVAVATSDRDAWDADQVEFDTNAGPCVDALRDGDYNSIEDLELEDRWRTWTTVAGLLGFRSALGIPAEVAPEGHRIALNAYGRTAAAFNGEPIRRCELLVAEVASALPAALRVFDQAALITDLQGALVSRSTIDQALGVLMGQNRCSRDEAFGLLRRASQNSNVKLRDVAAAIIQRFTGQPLPPPPTFTTRERSPGRDAAISGDAES